MRGATTYVIDDDSYFWQARNGVRWYCTSFRKALLGLLTKSLGSFCLAAASTIADQLPAPRCRCRAPAAHVPALLQLALLVRCCETNR